MSSTDLPLIPIGRTAREELPLFPCGRKSSKENPVVSRERQEAVTAAWGERTGTPLHPFVWEGGVSGNKDWRDRGVGLALQACREGKAGGIVVEDQTRLSRQNGLATAELWEVFQNEGFRLVCIADGLDTNNGDQELNFTMRAAFAREQWKQYARRMENVKKTRIEKGVHISGNVPFGYRRPDVGAKLVIDKVEGRLVKRIFKMRAGKATLGEVQRFLVAETGRPWTMSRIKQMLRNRVYLGEARQGKYVNPDAHPALVEQGVFDVVQAKFQPSTAARSDAKHLLAGIVRCSGCGYGMRRSRTGGKYFVYRCDDRTGACQSPTSIMADALEEYVSDEWRKRIGEGVALMATKVVAPDDSERILAELEVARQNRAVYLNPAVAGRLGAADLATALDNADAEIDRLEDELAQHVNRNGGGQDAPDPTELLRLFDEGTTNEQRELLAGSIEAVTVSRAPRGTSLVDRVRLHWVGDGTAPVRPSRGRPRKADAVKVEAGVSAT